MLTPPSLRRTAASGTDITRYPISGSLKASLAIAVTRPDPGPPVMQIFITFLALKEAGVTLGRDMIEDLEEFFVILLDFGWISVF